MTAVIQFLMLLAILVLTALLLIYLGAHFWLTVLVLAVMYMALTTLPTLYLNYKSRNLRAIDRFLLRNYRKPIYKYAYTVGNGSDEEIRISLKEVMDKYPQPDIHHVYGALLAVNQHDGDKVLRHAGQIGHEPHQSYYCAYGYALNREFNKARETTSRIPEKMTWMKHTIEAVIAKEKGDMETFRKESAAAKENASGIQYYLLHHNFRKMEEVKRPD